MNWYHTIFYLFEALVIISAIGLLLSRNVFYAALWIIVCLLGIAGLYVLAFAEFVAVTQIMIYAGGILVVIIFGIMLTNRIGTARLKVEHNNIFSGVLLTLPLFALLIYFLSQKAFTAELSAPNMRGTSQLEEIGTNLMTEYVLPFEVSGILLLAALIGAAVIASKKTSSS